MSLLGCVEVCSSTSFVRVNFFKNFYLFVWLSPTDKFACVVFLARLVSEELGKRETNSENGWDKTVVIYKKQKWTVPNGKRAVREVLKRKPTMAEENEKNCKCFDLVVSHAESSFSVRTEIYLLTSLLLTPFYYWL